MAGSKTGGSLKAIFDPTMKAAAAAQMEPQTTTEPVAGNGGRNRKAGGRNVRISGYIPAHLDEALRDEVVKRTVAERKPVSLNDVLCDALTVWKQSQDAGK